MPRESTDLLTLTVFLCSSCSFVIKSSLLPCRRGGTQECAVAERRKGDVKQDINFIIDEVQQRLIFTGSLSNVHYAYPKGKT